MKFSATMAIAIAETIDHGGELVRHAGGFWTYPGCPRRPHDGVPEWYVGGTTVQALNVRGALAYTEWRPGRRGEFPIRAAVTAEYSAAGRKPARASEPMRGPAGAPAAREAEK